MAYIEKRKIANGKISYRVRVRLKGLPEKTKSCSSFDEAKRWARIKEAELSARRNFGRDESLERTFSEFIDRYIEKELPKNLKSFKKQKLLLSWWKKHLGKYFLSYINAPMIAELRDLLMTEKTPRGNFRTPSTSNRYIAALSKAFNVCKQEWHWIKENPVSEIKRPKENKSKERYLDKNEIIRLLEACKKSKSPHLYPVTLFALSTGARKGEILGLKWDDVDLSRSTATFRDTKNGENRTVHLSEQILNCLKEERSKRTVLSEYVFPNTNGRKPADIKTSWENAIQVSCIKGVTFHTCRHTLASHLAMKGMSTLEIGAILGHKTLSMVKRYSHLSTSSTAKALDQLNKEILDGCINV